ncbi:MAG: DUF4364 family protein [Lachnospiraceae bacterium]|nr:DUF4364 family protein [Lachnospiraceae bacterium]
MRPESIMFYKLIILYTLSRSDYPLSNSQLTSFILENGYTDYFNVQQTLGELISDGYVNSQKTSNTTLYVASDSGREAMGLLIGSLSPDVRNDIDSYLTENRYRLLDEISTPAEFYKEKEGVYTARLRILDRGFVMFELNISLSSEEEASHVCGMWRSKSSKLYGQVIAELLGN